MKIEQLNILNLIYSYINLFTISQENEELRNDAWSKWKDVNTKLTNILREAALEAYKHNQIEISDKHMFFMSGKIHTVHPFGLIMCKQRITEDQINQFNRCKCTLAD